jgi:WD40 repeat protein
VRPTCRFFEKPRGHRRNTLGILLICLLALGAVQLILELRRNTAGRDNRFVGDVAYSPEGDRLAWISESDGGGTLVVWDVVRSRRLLAVRTRDCDPDASSRGVSTFTSLAFSPDGGTIATAVRSSPNADPRVFLVDLKTGRTSRVLRGHSDAIISVAYSPDGKTLATASRDRTVKLWDALLANARATLRTGSVAVSSLAFSPDGLTLASGWGDGEIRLWDVANARLSAQFKGHSQAVACLAYSPKDKRLASAGSDGALRLWDTETLGELSVHGRFSHPFRWIAFAPDGKTLAIKFAETSRGTLWDVAEGKEKATFANAAGSFAFAPDGRTLATAGGAKDRVFLVPLSPAAQRLSTNPR